MTKIFLFSICILLSSCKPSELTQEELQSFILEEKNGLLHSTAANGTKVSVAYRPTDMWVYQEINDAAINREVIDSLRNKYSEYYYFILSLSRSDKEALHMVGDAHAYSELVETMSFQMPAYVTLTTPSMDTIQVGDFMMNRTYGLGSSTDILFAFNKEKVKDSKWVQFNLNEFGLGLGNQRFRFSTDELEEAPRVRFSVIN